MEARQKHRALGSSVSVGNWGPSQHSSYFACMHVPGASRGRIISNSHSSHGINHKAQAADILETSSKASQHDSTSPSFCKPCLDAFTQYFSHLQPLCISSGRAKPTPLAYLVAVCIVSRFHSTECRQPNKIYINKAIKPKRALYSVFPPNPTPFILLRE
jgi:hypothetical protein